MRDFTYNNCVSSEIESPCLQTAHSAFKIVIKRHADSSLVNCVDGDHGCCFAGNHRKQVARELGFIET